MKIYEISEKLHGMSREEFLSIEEGRVKSPVSRIVIVPEPCKGEGANKEKRSFKIIEVSERGGKMVAIPNVGWFGLNFLSSVKPTPMIVPLKKSVAISFSVPREYQIKIVKDDYFRCADIIICKR